MLANIGFFCISYGISRKIAVAGSNGGVWAAGMVCVFSLLAIIIMGK
jgi:hypothetical protein